MDDMEYEYNENESEEEIAKKKKKYTKGFYAVFALCLCAIGAAGWYTYADVVDYMNDTSIPDTAQTATEPQNKQAEVKVDGVEKDEIPANTQPTNPTEEPTEEETEATQPPTQPQKTMPLENAQVIAEFSGDRVVYFETLKDWRVHKGTDYKADKGEKVYAVSSGTVTDFLDDTLYGKGVKLELSDGFTAMYYGVDYDESLAIGSTLNVGDLIGVADSVPCEKEKEAHIHLEIQKDGNYINPQTFLNKNV